VVSTADFEIRRDALQEDLADAVTEDLDTTGASNVLMPRKECSPADAEGTFGKH
jgi:hypothetical protein